MATYTLPERDLWMMLTSCSDFSTLTNLIGAAIERNPDNHARRYEHTFDKTNRCSYFRGKSYESQREMIIDNMVDGLDVDLVRRRIAKGWTMAQSLNTPRRISVR